MIVTLKIISDCIIYILGLIFGSFFNVCIYRIPKGESIAYPPSHCGNCNHILKWYELIPVFSWIFLRGKCSKCGEKISPQYPLVEIFTGIIYIVIFLFFGLSINTLKYIVLFSILIISSIIDIKTQEVYFSISLVGFIFGIIFSIIGIFNGEKISTIVISILIPLVILGLIYLISKAFDGFGAGDLEVFLFSSLYMKPYEIALAIFLAIVLGGVVSIFYLLKGERRKRIPFVPFIALGCLISVTVGKSLLNLYFSLL